MDHVDISFNSPSLWLMLISRNFFNNLEHIFDKPEGTEPNCPDPYSFTVWVFGEIWLQVAVSSKSKTKKKKEVLIYDPKH